MARLRIVCALLLLTSTLAAQSQPPSRYRIVFDSSNEILAAINDVAAESYRVILAGSGAYLMERVEGDESYQYVKVDELAPKDLRDHLNLSGSRGYRVVGRLGRGMLFPGSELLMEKAPGRPNQFQYVLENGHHLTMRRFLPHDEFSQAPALIVARVREGYSVAAQVGVLTVFEKAAEPAGDPIRCVDAACYDLRVLDTRKRFAEALTDAGRDGFRFTTATFWTGMSTTSMLTLLVRKDAHTYEYRTVPARHDRIEAPLQAASADGFCVQARVYALILLERSPGSPACEYRVVYGPAAEVEHGLELAAGEGFRPVLLSPEIHAGFTRVKANFTVVAERIRGGAKP